MNRLIPVLTSEAKTFEILFVDDGSSDHTIDTIATHARSDPRVKAIVLSRNFGKEIALSAGLEHAVGMAIVTMDSDLQRPPEVIGEMIELWRQGYDVVYGVRRTRGYQKFHEALLAKTFYRVFNRVSDTHIPSEAGDFRLMSRRTVDSLNELPERNRFMKGLYAWIGYRQVGVKFEVDVRQSGSSMFRVFKLWRYALDGLTAFSNVPLQLSGYLGVLISLMAILYGIYVVIYSLIFGVDQPGYTTLIFAIVLLGGVQLITLGILGEYIGRIMIEVKKRPLYVIKYKINLDRE